MWLHNTRCIKRIVALEWILQMRTPLFRGLGLKVFKDVSEILVYPKVPSDHQVNQHFVWVLLLPRPFSCQSGPNLKIILTAWIFLNEWIDNSLFWPKNGWVMAKNVSPNVGRNQNLPPPKTIPKRMADAQGTKLYFLSELSRIHDSLQRQQQEMKEHLMRLTVCGQPDLRHNSYPSSHPPMYPLTLYRDVLLTQHQPWTTTAQAPQPSHPSIC